MLHAHRNFHGGFHFFYFRFTCCKFYGKLTRTTVLDLRPGLDKRSEAVSHERGSLAVRRKLNKRLGTERKHSLARDQVNPSLYESRMCLYFFSYIFPSLLRALGVSGPAFPYQKLREILKLGGTCRYKSHLYHT